MLSRWLPLEKPLVEIEEQIEELKRLAARENIDLSEQIARLEDRKRQAMEHIFQELTPWEKVQMARHPKRPYTLDYVGALCSEWVEFHGDRAYGDDGAIVAGFARFNGRAVAVVGNQKGRDTKNARSATSATLRPRAYAKRNASWNWQRAMGDPSSLLSIRPAQPAPGCRRARHQRSHRAQSARDEPTAGPIIVVITGEGASGGAIALALGDRVLMLEHSYYSVITPEGCASILYRSSEEEARIKAAENLKLTAQDALRMKVIEEIVAEPLGGAHRNFGKMCISMGEALDRHLNELLPLSSDELVDRRYRRFRCLGDFAGDMTEAGVDEAAIPEQNAA
jgi:acetyl-CoA carboxylase carboxyl transferase subunit alpha